MLEFGSSSIHCPKTRRKNQWNAGSMTSLVHFSSDKIKWIHKSENKNVYLVSSGSFWSVTFLCSCSLSGAVITPGVVALLLLICMFCLDGWFWRNTSACLSSEKYPKIHFNVSIIACHSINIMGTSRLFEVRRLVLVIVSVQASFLSICSLLPGKGSMRKGKTLQRENGTKNKL